MTTAGNETGSWSAKRNQLVLIRRLMTELVYGTVKAVGTIDWYLQQCVTRPLNKIDKLVLNVLRVSVYQLLYMDKIPASAACNEAVNLARLFSHEGTAKFVNGVLRGLLRKKDSFIFPDAEKETADYISLAMYHPRWLVKKHKRTTGQISKIFRQTPMFCFIKTVHHVYIAIL